MSVSSAEKTPLRRRVVKKTLLYLGAGLFILFGVLLVNTLRFKRAAASVTPVTDIPVDAEAASFRLAQAVRFETISQSDTIPPDSSAFAGLHAFLEAAFPTVHATLHRETVGGLSLLYTWPGQQPARPPVLLMAHQDVVPIDANSAEDWTHPPFAGVVGDGYIWGRGTLDDKSGMLALLEAVELLLQTGFQPQQTVYLVFGHDEEIGGEQGAKQIAETLASRGVSLALVLDEGGLMIEGALPGVEEPMAIIGTAEKGYMSLELTVESAGGHSSRPPKNTAIGVISQAVTRLEAQPFPPRIDGATEEMFMEVGPLMPLGQRLILANLWLFRPLMARLLGAGDNTSATVRTTTAATMISGGEKDNVLPTKATAVVNFRLLPGDTPEQVIEHVRRAIDDPRVQLRPLSDPQAASPVSSSTTAVFALLKQSIREVSPEDDLIVAPYLTVGGTDAKHFTSLSDNVYRFIGWKLGPGDLDRVHGTDERLAVDEYARAIRFYYQVLRNLNEQM